MGRRLAIVKLLDKFIQETNSPLNDLKIGELQELCNIQMTLIEISHKKNVSKEISLISNIIKSNYIKLR